MGRQIGGEIMGLINFVNFLTMLIWAVVKLFGSMILCCIVFCICWGLLISIADIVRKDANDRFNVWQEIEEMERSDYGD